MLRLGLLAGSFFLGLLWGRCAALRVPQEALMELEAYLLEFIRLERLPLPETVFSTVMLYFRYPVLAFLLGFTSVGVFFLPLTGMAFAFFLSFSVCCFTAVFGSGGVVLAMAVFGFRCAVTVPCFFLLAIPSLETGLAGRSKKGRASCGKETWLRLATVTGVLLSGVLIDLIISPHLLHLVLGHILN